LRCLVLLPIKILGGFLSNYSRLVAKRSFGERVVSCSYIIFGRQLPCFPLTSSTKLSADIIKVCMKKYHCSQALPSNTLSSASHYQHAVFDPAKITSTFDFLSPFSY